MIQKSLDGRLTLTISTACELADDAFLAVGTEPVRGTCDAFGTDGRTDADVGCAGPVAVEVLVHLIDDSVVGVGQCFQVVIDGGPGPCTGVAVAFHVDVLACGASSPDGIDGGLVEVQDKGLVHVMIFVVGIEDDTGVGAESGSEVPPEGSKGCGVGDDGTVVAAEVVRITED